MRRVLAPVVVMLTAGVLLIGLLTAPASAEPRHRIDASITRITNHKFVVHGKLTLRQQRFQVLKRFDRTRDFRPLERPRAGGRGHFRFTVTGDPGDCFQMRLPETRRFRETVVSLGCIHLKRS